jgi:cell division septation protein DedD
MAGREEGEFELILGNKQLLSVLFIVIVLLGIVFAMGFLAGRSTGAAGAQMAKATPHGPIRVDSTPRNRPAEPADLTPVPTSEETPQPASKGAPAKEQEKPAPPKEVRSTDAGPPAPGTYLQVAATTRQQADNMLQLLAEKGFRVATAPAPTNPELFRVLVGPLPAGEDMARTRESLRALGIDKTFVVKY